ncbi:hypothetical protein [uncultured Clostridium sp.]|uniref:hypothetical protein n=1 Tax=uncultured Clostridium sp. TaxID=59620 RepID=UPI0028EA1649|nr:hypothetical protein [uncultured Clostridium sp.]
MAKRIVMKDVEKIELEFADKTVKEILFNSRSVAVMDEEFEGVFKVMAKIHSHPYEVGSKVVYAGMKVCDEDITFEEVKALTAKMPFDVIMELIGEFAKNINKEHVTTSKDAEELKKTLLKEMFQK